MEERQGSPTAAAGSRPAAQYSNVDDFGLMYYNARWYDPALGRFAQADTVVPAGAQGYDRYAYVGNNPVNNVDPSGHRECDEEFGCGTERYESAAPERSEGGKSGGDGRPDPEGMGETERPGVRCQRCILTGSVIILAMVPVELAIGIGMVLAFPEPAMPVLEAVLLLPEAAAVDVTLIGLQYIAQGQNRAFEDVHIDALAILPTPNHMFNPDIWK